MVRVVTPESLVRMVQARAVRAATPEPVVLPHQGTVATQEYQAILVRAATPACQDIRASQGTVVKVATQEYREPAHQAIQEPLDSQHQATVV